MPPEHKVGRSNRPGRATFHKNDVLRETKRLARVWFYRSSTSESELARVTRDLARRLAGVLHGSSREGGALSATCLRSIEKRGAEPRLSLSLKIA